MFPIINFYKFIKIGDPEAFRVEQQELGTELGLIGTVQVAPEGINGMLSGTEGRLAEYIRRMQADPRFSAMRFARSMGKTRPFSRFKTKLKDFIVVFDPEFHVSVEEIGSAPHMSADEWAEHLAAKNDEVVILDTRNYYEVDYGTFENAEDLKIRNFRQFPEKFLEKYGDQKDKKFLMFCTGGIRCEKAAVFARRAGFENVYQLDGGIIKYFEDKGRTGYQGSCFVFDHRWAITADKEQAPDGPHPDQLDRVPEIASQHL